MPSNRAPARHGELQRPVGLAGRAPRRPGSCPSSPLDLSPALLLGLGDVHPLEVEGEAGRRQRRRRTAASARRSARRRRARGRARGRRPRGSRRCSSRGRAAARGRAGPARPHPGHSSASKVSLSRLVARSTASPPSSRASVEHLAPAAHLAQRDAASRRCSALDLRRARPAPPRGPTRSWVASLPRTASRGLALDPQLGEELAVEVGVAEADHGPCRGPAASSAAHRGPRPPPRSRRAPSAPISSTPAWANSRICPRCGRTARNSVGDVAEAERRLGAGEAVGDQPGDRDRHVGAQREQLAALVEEAVGAVGGRARRRAPSPRRTRSSAC